MSPLSKSRRSLFIVFSFMVLTVSVLAIAATGRAPEPGGAGDLAPVGVQPRVLQPDTVGVGNVTFTDPVGANMQAFHLKADMPGTVTPTSLKVTENTQYHVPQVDLESGYVWFPPFKDKYPGGQGVETTVKWQLVIGGHFLDSGQHKWLGKPSETEWHNLYLDEKPYPYSSSEFTNEKRRIIFDLDCDIEAFDEGVNDVQMLISGSTYIKIADWVPGGDWLHPNPVEWKKFDTVLVPGTATVEVERPFQVWKFPPEDSFVYPHQAELWVSLLDSNLTRTAFKGNIQDFEHPFVHEEGRDGQINPETLYNPMFDFHRHDGTHPPDLVHVTPDFSPIEIDIYHREWDVPANQGRVYHRHALLNPTTLFCTLDGEPDSVPGAPAPEPYGDPTLGGKKPKRSLKTTAATIQPYGSPGFVTVGPATVNVQIVSLALGRPTQVWDATPDGNGEWACLGCLSSGDEVELRYEYRDIFGYHYADAINVSVPDSFDLAAPDTVEAGQPALVFTKAENDPDPLLNVQGFAFDLGSLAFDLLRPVAGAVVSGGPDFGEVLTDDDGAFAFEVPHDAVLDIAVNDAASDFLALLMPPTPPINANVSHREVGPGQWQDDRMYLWLTPSFANGRLHRGSGEIYERDGVLFSRVGAVSDIDPATVLSATFETLLGDFVAPAVVREWGATPPPNLPYVPALFALVESSGGGAAKSDPAFQAALQAVIDAGGARLRVGTDDGLDHVVDLPLEQPGLSEVGDTPRRGELALQVVPNPFNPATTLSFVLDEAGVVELDIYQIDGRHVATLFDGRLDAGPRHVDWHGRDDRGSEVASGVYLARLKTNGQMVTRKVMLVR